MKLLAAIHKRIQNLFLRYENSFSLRIVTRSLVVIITISFVYVCGVKNLAAAGLQFGAEDISSETLAWSRTDETDSLPVYPEAANDVHSLTTTYVAGAFPQAFPIHGVAGDHALLFAAQPSAGVDTEPGVHVMRRLDGLPAGKLTPPPEGWGVPLSLYVDTFERQGVIKTQGELLVSDVRIPPAAALVSPQPARIYRYRYSYSPAEGFSSELIETGSLPVNTVPPGAGLPDGIVYLGSYTVLPTGQILASDTLAGAIWAAPGIEGPWNMTIIDQRFAPAPVENVAGVQRTPDGGEQNYFLVLPAPPGAPSIGPGIESLTYVRKTDEVCMVSNAQGGIYCIPRDVLLDLDIPAFVKGEYVRTVVDPMPGLNDFTDGITADRFHPNSPWLYWHRAPSDTTPFDGSGYNTLRRVHLLTGEIEIVSMSNTYFDWTFEIAPLPPLVINSPYTGILSSMGQGPNNPELNMTLEGEISYVAPSLMPITVTTSW